MQGSSRYGRKAATHTIHEEDEPEATPLSNMVCGSADGILKQIDSFLAPAPWRDVFSHRSQPHELPGSDSQHIVSSLHTLIVTLVAVGAAEFEARIGKASKRFRCLFCGFSRTVRQV